jgi:NAD(P)H-dependent FMN reductase
MDGRPLSILAISGSLRASSANTAVLRAAMALAPAALTISLYDGLAQLPHFNPDLDGETVPPPVTEFRRLLAAADGVLISCPEYAHGVPGSLKNALDWVVSSGEFVDKPVALINASPHSTWALASLTEILTVMSARIIGEAAVTLPLATNRIDGAGVMEDPSLAGPLRAGLAIFVAAI